MTKIYFMRTPYVMPDVVYNAYIPMTPGCRGVWDNIEAVVDPKQADIFIVFGRIPSPDECPPERTIIIGREPKVFGGYVELRGVGGFLGVYHHDMGNIHLPVLWTTKLNYDDLTAMDRPISKSKRLSTIVSDKSFLPGHRYRLDFIAELCGLVDIDIFGNGGALMPPAANTFGYIDTKDEGIRDYKFTVGIENCRSPGYFTGKLVDVLLLWGIPIYWGCPDINKYFSVFKSFHDTGAILEIDHELPILEAAKKVVEMLSLVDQDEMVESAIMEKVAEARDLVLNRYQFWPTIHSIINKDL